MSGARFRWQAAYVSWISPRCARRLAALCLASPLWTACGRIGFEALSDTRTGGPSAGGGDAAVREPAEDGSTAPRPSDAGVGIESGGQADAGNADGGPSLDPCGLTPAPLACSDFEQGTLPANMTIEISGGNIDLSQGFLLASSDGASDSAFVAATFPPVTSGSVYLRMSMRVPASADLTAVNFAALAQRGQADATGIDFNVTDSLFEIYSHQTTQRYLCTACSRPLIEQWFCFVTRLDLSNNAGRVRTWVDGELVHDVTNIDTSPPGGIGQAAVGINWTGADQGSAALIIDDFAVSTAVLTGCP